jgi:hypothetical protein
MSASEYSNISLSLKKKSRCELGVAEDIDDASRMRMQQRNRCDCRHFRSRPKSLRRSIIRGRKIYFRGLSWPTTYHNTRELQGNDLVPYHRAPALRLARTREGLSERPLILFLTKSLPTGNAVVKLTSPNHGK